MKDVYGVCIFAELDGEAALAQPSLWTLVWSLGLMRIGQNTALLREVGP